MICPTCGKPIVRGVCGCGKRDIRDLKKLPPQFRTIAISRAAVQEDSRTIPLSFSSEAPVERWWGTEILDHSPGSVRLDRLRSGAPLLADHDTRIQVGKVETVSIGADRVGRSDVRFGKSPRAEQEYQDVLDEIRTNVSVGYLIHAMVLEREDDSGCTYRVTDWEPYEISTVSVPADITVGVGRDKTTWEDTEITITLKTSEVTQETKPEDECTDTETETKTSCADPNNTDTEERTMKCPKCGRDLVNGACSCGHREHASATMTVNVEDARKQARADEQTRVREIMAIAEKHPALAETAREFINSDKTLDEFRSIALESLGAQPVSQTPEIGMSDKEKRQYSIVRAMATLADCRPLDGLEREASDAVSKLTKREAKGFFIPQDMMTANFNRANQQMQMYARALTAGTFGSGGATVQDTLLVADMISLLRNKPLVARMGARTLSGLVGNIAIPRITGGATAYWLPETGGVTPTDQAFGQLGLVPRRLVGDTAYSKELLIQSSLDIESFVREDLMTVLALEKDRAAINGLGSAGEPVGILNTTGIGTVTFGAAATWAKIVDFETQVANSNADVGQMGYLSTPNVRAKLKAIQKATNLGFIWENGSEAGTGTVNTYRAEATKQVPGDKVLFGNWSDLIIAEWSGIDVVVDPYSQKKNGLIEITLTLWTDIGVRHAGSFCVSTDSGAQ